MSTESYLPPNWVPDPTLKHLLPAKLDYREFVRIPENPDRYAASICGAGVWDIHRRRFLKPKRGKKAPRRRRYRIAMGPDSKPIHVAYNRLVCQLVHGPCPFPDGEAHHADEDPGNDDWRNLRWQTSSQNRAMALIQRKRRKAQKRAEKQRHGERNGRIKLRLSEISAFIARHDEYRAAGYPIDWKGESWFFDISERQLQRLAAGKSRAADVAAIRRHLAGGNK